MDRESKPPCHVRSAFSAWAVACTQRAASCGTGLPGQPWASRQALHSAGASVQFYPKKKTKPLRAEAVGARRRRLVLSSHGATRTRHPLARRRSSLGPSAGRPGGSGSAAPAQTARVLQLRVRAGMPPVRRNAAPGVANSLLAFRSLLVAW